MSATVKDTNESTVSEIQAAIQKLPASEGWKLLRWLEDYLNEEWDKEKWNGMRGKAGSTI